MTREGALLVMVAVAVLLLALMAWGWRRRARRDATPLTAVRELRGGDDDAVRFDALYVATTRHDEPMERIAAPGLGFPAKGTVLITPAGVALDLAGSDRIVIPADRIDSVEQSGIAIDRVVEAEGLVCLAWRTDPGTIVDTYLRPRDASARALADAIRPLITTHRTGSAA